MKYTILSAEQQQDTLITNVRFDLDGTLVDASISHFQPASKEEVELGISNRAASELRKIEAAQLCQSIVPVIETNVEKDL